MRRIPWAFLLPCVLLFGTPTVEGADWRNRLPRTASPEYTAEDTVEESQFGREVAARILGRFRYDADRELQTYVGLVGGAVARNTNRSDLTFRFAVVQGEEVNAYSTPGGYVFVTTGALALMENEAELAGVLAHEIAHVAERHIVRELNLRGSGDTGMIFLATLIGGASESAGVTFTQAVEKAVDILFLDGYRREDEMEADRRAALLTAMAGYDPNALISFLSRVEARKGQTGRSYPSYPERREVLSLAIGEDHLSVSSFTGGGRFVKAMKK